MPRPRKMIRIALAAISALLALLVLIAWVHSYWYLDALDGLNAKSNMAWSVLSSHGVLEIQLSYEKADHPDAGNQWAFGGQQGKLIVGCWYVLNLGCHGQAKRRHALARMPAPDTAGLGHATQSIPAPIVGSMRGTLAERLGFRYLRAGPLAPPHWVTIVNLLIGFRLFCFPYYRHGLFGGSEGSEKG